MGFLSWLIPPPPWGQGRPEIVGPGGSQGPKNSDSEPERLNQLETRVERLELDNAERQMAVLGAMEKVLHQLRAREAKRAREAGAEPTDGDGDGVLASPAPGPRHNYPAPSSTLSKRFRRF